MAVIIVIGLGIYLFINKNPANYRDLVVNANTYLKYLPIDKNTQSIMAPIIDLTSRSLQNKNNNNFNGNYTNTMNNLTPQQQKILTSGGRATKRSVSETKKKICCSKSKLVL